MPKMTDPNDALVSFQQALLDGKLELQPGRVDPGIHFHHDKPNGELRFTYARVVEGKVVAIAIFAVADPVKDIPCFGIGYAVPVEFRGQGHAKQMVNAAIAEMQAGFGRSGMSAFYVEAIIGSDNEASKGVAKATLSPVPVQVKDNLSGLPAFQYLRKVSCW